MRAGWALAAAGDGGVRITINGAPGRYLTHDDLLAPGAVDQPPLSTTSRVNGHDTTVQVGGTTAAKLVQLAGVGLPALLDMSVTFAGSSGRPVTLGAADVKDGLFGDPLGANPRYATFDAGAETEVRFFEPLRASSDASSYSVDPPGRTDLLVDLHTTGHRLAVHLLASSTQVDAGQRVSFSAQVDPAPSGEPTYAWDFEGDHQPAETAAASSSHLYARDGSYQASLTVTTRDGSSGTDSVVIGVGKPSSGGTSSTPTSPAATLSAGGGAAGGGGKATNGGGSAGPHARNSGPARSPGAGSRAVPRDAAKQSRSASPVNVRAVGPPKLARPASRPQPRFGAPLHRAPRLSRPPLPGRGIPVRGVLLADASALQGGLPYFAAPAATLAPAAARAGAGSPTGLLGWLAGAALCVALLLSGAMREIRPLARRALRSA